MADTKKTLKICIIGAGIGGLSTALALSLAGFQHIDIYEQTRSSGFFTGAGIQLTPNMVRILDQGFGIWKTIRKDAVPVDGVAIRRGSDDEELGRIDLTYIEPTFGYPWMVGHRFSLVDALQTACEEEGGRVRFHFSHKAEVVSYSSAPTVWITPRHSGDDEKLYEVKPDIVIAADGVKSTSRESLLRHLGVTASVEDTGQSAYRLMIPRAHLASDPSLLALIDTNGTTRWIGRRKKHIVAYPIAGHQLYNVVTVQPDTNFAAAPSATYTNRGSKAAMLDVLAEFCPTLRRLLALIPEDDVCEWRLRVHAPLPTWVLGGVALLGDACHPMLPHMGQGAAQAMEDAAVMAVVLARMPDGTPEGVSKALRVYEKVRKGRAEALVELAAASGKMLMLDEAEAIEKRDRQLALLGKAEGAVEDKWLDREVQDMVYGHDCVRAAEEMFGAEYAALEE